jgi:hypothetical protein
VVGTDGMKINAASAATRPRDGLGPERSEGLCSLAASQAGLGWWHDASVLISAQPLSCEATAVPPSLGSHAAQSRTPAQASYFEVLTKIISRCSRQNPVDLRQGGPPRTGACSQGPRKGPAVLTEPLRGSGLDRYRVISCASELRDVHLSSRRTPRDAS